MESGFSYKRDATVSMKLLLHKQIVITGTCGNKSCGSRMCAYTYRKTQKARLVRCLGGLAKVDRN